MTRTISILCLAILFSCDNSSKKKINDGDLEGITILQQESIVKVREFDEKLNLFLEFYHGMNPMEFRQVANKELKSQQLFYLDYKDNQREEYDLRFSSLLDSTYFPNSKGFDKEKDFPYDFNSNLYYSINTSEKTYFTILSAEFDSQKLTSISFSGPSFIFPLNSENGKNQRIEESRKYKEEILKMYSGKYGKPKISQMTFDQEDVWDLFFEKHFNKDIYVFEAGEKTIEIYGSDNHTVVNYMLTSEYKNLKNNKQLIKNQKVEEQKKAKSRTLEEI